MVQVTSILYVPAVCCTCTDVRLGVCFVTPAARSSVCFGVFRLRCGAHAIEKILAPSRKGRLICLAEDRRHLMRIRSVSALMLRVKYASSCGVALFCSFLGTQHLFWLLQQRKGLQLQSVLPFLLFW